MESMTGYAFVESKTKQFSFSVEIKSLNTKFLEVYVNVPKILRYEENAYMDSIKKFFKRGKIEVNVDIYDWIELRNIDINTKLLKKYYNELKKVENEIKVKEFSLDTILGMEGVISRGRTQILDVSKKEILRSLNNAVKDAMKMKKEEGKSLGNDLLNSVKEIEMTAAEIKKLAKDVSKNNFEKLKFKIKKISGSEIDETRLYTEVALLCDKLDINEEVIRLTDHIKKFRSIMKEKGTIGKKLDFIAQEMFREINTIASKSNNSKISQYSVLIKNNIDKIREQSRNIV